MEARMNQIPKIKITVSLFALIMVLSLVFARAYLSLAALLAAALHELGHIGAARVCRVRFSALKLNIFGASLSSNGEIPSYRQEIFIAACGPAANLFCVAVMAIFASHSKLTATFISASLMLALINLLPIYELDGGRILFSTLALKTNYGVALALLKISSFVLIFALWTLSVYLLLRLGASLSLFVFSAYLFCRIFISART